MDIGLGQITEKGEQKRCDVNIRIQQNENKIPNESERTSELAKEEEKKNEL